MPLSRLVSLAALSAALTSSRVVSRDGVKVRSTMLPSGTGTRIAEPSSLPFNSGSTSPTARAAPVVFGIIDIAAARARAWVFAVNDIAAYQPGVRLGVGEIVDADQLEPAVGPLEDCPGDQPADAAETVDCNSRHAVSLCLRWSDIRSATASGVRPK